MAACGVTSGYRRMAKKILIVDDEEEIRAELAGYLRDKGYEVEEAADGLEALEKFEASPADAVIGDMKMPRCPGDELTRRLRAVDPDLPVIILTGHYTNADVESARKAGATAVLKKPARLSELRRLLEHLTEAPEG